MSFLQSVLINSDSIIKVCIGYIISIIIFSLYNKRFKVSIDAQTNRKIVPVFEKLLWRVLIIFPVAYTAGIRGYTTGADTKDLWYEYIQSQDMSASEIFNNDIGTMLYVLVRCAISKITGGNVQIFFFFCAFVTMCFVILAIECWGIKYAGFSLFVFYSCFGLLMMNQMRQMLAVSIVFYACYFICHDNKKKFFVLALIAGFIHSTAWFSSIIIWFLVIERNKKTIVVKINRYRSENMVLYILIGVACLALPTLIPIILNTVLANTKYHQYITASSEEMSVGFGFILTLIPTVCPLLFLKRKKEKYNEFYDLLLMVIPFRLAGYYIYYIYRMFYYFGIVNMVAFPKLVEHSKIKNKRLLMCCIAVCCITYFLIYYCWLSKDVYFPYVTFREVDFKW